MMNYFDFSFLQPKLNVDLYVMGFQIVTQKPSNKGVFAQHVRGAATNRDRRLLARIRYRILCSRISLALSIQFNGPSLRIRKYGCYFVILFLLTPFSHVLKKVPLIAPKLQKDKIYSTQVSKKMKLIAPKSQKSTGAIAPKNPS